MIKNLLSVLLLSATGIAIAENTSLNHFQATLYGGVYLNNEQAWQLEPSIAWHFHKYIGAAFGMEITSQYNQPSRQTTIDGHMAELTDNDRNVTWIIFKPSIIFKSPDIWKSEDRYFRIWAQAEPGISMGCPSHNSLTYEIRAFQGNIGHTVDYRRFRNKGLQWFYWNARASINFAIDRCIIGAGYSISNLDYYSGRRNVTLANGHKFYVPQKELSQSVFLSVGYSF